MNKKYDEAMKHIEVTPEMRNRILMNLRNANFEEKKSAAVVQFPNIKRFAALAACLVAILAGAFTFLYLQNPTNKPPILGNNGIIEVSSVKALSETVGFDIIEPDVLPFEPNNIVYTAYWAEIAEVVYTSDEQTAVFRKGPGTDDISGNYDFYELTAEISVNNLNITLKAHGELYTLAIWTDGEFAYSLSLNEGIEEAEWIRILQTIID